MRLDGTERALRLEKPAFSRFFYACMFFDARSDGITLLGLPCLESSLVFFLALSMCCGAAVSEK
jgi:hypothetical protein